MNSARIRIIFIIVLIYLPLQYAAVGIIGSMRSEPWPSFVFPGFKNVYDSGETVILNKPTIYHAPADGTAERIPTWVMFDGIPVSHHRGMLRYQFLRHGVDEESGRKYISDEAVAWFNNQLGKGGMPDFDASRLIVVWYRDYYRISDNRMTLMESVPADTVFITPKRMRM